MWDSPFKIPRCTILRVLPDNQPSPPSKFKRRMAKKPSPVFFSHFRQKKCNLRTKSYQQYKGIGGRVRSCHNTDRVGTRSSKRNAQKATSHDKVRDSRRSYVLPAPPARHPRTSPSRSRIVALISFSFRERARSPPPTVFLLTSFSSLFLQSSSLPSHSNQSSPRNRQVSTTRTHNTAVSGFRENKPRWTVSARWTLTA